MHYVFYKIRWYLFLTVLLLMGITLMKYSAWIDRTFFGSSRASSSARQQPVPAPGQAPGVASATPAHGPAPPATAADVRLQLSQANSLLAEASTNASEALKEVLKWQTEVEPLRDQVLAETSVVGEEGSHVKLFERLAYVLRRDRTSAQELRSAAARIDSLRIKIADLLKQSSPAALSPIEVAQISQLHAMCKQAEEDWQRDVEQALAIRHLIDLQAETATESTAPPTVGNKIEEADARAALADLEEQIKFEREREAQERARAAELEDQKRQQEEREAELLARATSPEVKVLLAPFLEPRTIQPSLAGTFSIRWVRTDETKPMSLGKLMSIGALDDSVLGLKKLALVVGNRKLPEPKWSIASQPNNWSPEDEARLKEAQQMLKDYGPILVKAGLLSE